jgi:hypothetical protein
MSVAQLKSKPEQGVFYRLRFNELPTINVRGAKLVAVVAEVGLAGGRLLRQAGL